MEKQIEKWIDGIGDYAGNILGAVLVFIGGIILIKLIVKLLKKGLERSSLDASVYKFIITTAKWILYIVIIVVMLTCLKVPTAPLVTVLGACGAAVALALKDSLGNIASGIIILASHPFRRGDTIEVGGVVGIVNTIDIMITTIKTFDNKVVSIPNGTITNSILINYSHENTRRVDCTFSISYGSDIGKAKEILLDVAKANDDIYKTPEPIIGVAAQKDSSVAVDLKVWCDTDKYFDVKYYLEEQVKIAFDKNGISIPFPQLDVRVVQ